MTRRERIKALVKRREDRRQRGISVVFAPMPPPGVKSSPDPRSGPQERAGEAGVGAVVAYLTCPRCRARIAVASTERRTKCPDCDALV